MDTGTKIKALRASAGMTQEELGKLLGVKRAAINKYETGIIVNLKRSTIEKLCKIFNVTPQFLLDDDYIPEEKVETKVEPAAPSGFSNEERLILAFFDELNDEGKALMLDYAELLYSSDKYKKRTCSDVEKKTAV